MTDTNETQIQQFNDSLQQLNRDKDLQTQIEPIDDHSFDNLSQISGSNASFSAGAKISEAGNKLMKMAGGVAGIFSEEKKQFQAGEQIDTLNPLIQAQAGQLRPPQDKKYCQLCYKELGLLVRKFHCWMCSRTCCGSCSSEVDKTRTCQYCTIKIENPQIDKFYQLGKVWRQTDMQMCLEKIDWYKKKSAEIREQYESEREAALILKAQAEAELIKIEAESNDLIDQKQYIDQGKKRLERSILDEQHTKVKVLERIEDAKNRKRELTNQLDSL